MISIDIVGWRICFMLYKSTTYVQLITLVPEEPMLIWCTIWGVEHWYSLKNRRMHEAICLFDTGWNKIQIHSVSSEHKFNLISLHLSNLLIHFPLVLPSTWCEYTNRDEWFLFKYLTFCNWALQRWYWLKIHSQGTKGKIRAGAEQFHLRFPTREL